MTLIKYLHVADTHNGYDGNASLHNEFKGLRINKITDTHLNVRTHDANEAFRQVIDLGIQHEVDLIVHAGDGLNKWGYKQPHIFNYYMEQVKRATTSGIEWVEIAGNHNFAKKAGVGNELFKLGLLDRVHTVYRGFYEPIDLPHLGVTCHAVPSTFNQEILDEELRKVQPYENRFNIGIGHFGVTTIPHYARNAERSLVVSLDQLISTRMHYFALGDYHKDVDFGHGIRYAGSTERFCFGEIANRPKVYLIEADTETGAYTETPLFLDVRPMLDIEPLDATNRSADELVSLIEEGIRKTEMTDAIVRYRVTNIPRHLLPILRTKEEEWKEMTKHALYFKLDLKDKTELSQTIRTGSDVEFEGVLDGFRSYMERIGDDASYDHKRVTAKGEYYLQKELDQS